MLSYKRTPDSRDKALELVEDGMVSAEDMLDTNELSERFTEEEDYA